MNRTMIAAAAVAAAALSAGVANAGTLVFDDFESYGNTSHLNFTGFTDLTVTSGSVDYVHEPDFGLHTPYGDGMVDLDGTTNAGGTLSTSTFALGAGQVVTLQFDASGNQRGGSDTWRFGFTFIDPTGISQVLYATPTAAGGPLGPFANVTSIYRPEATNSDFPWGHYLLSFRADQAGAFSAFIKADGGDNISVLVDNVSLDATAVPEPASWAMMLAGFGGMGALLRRRRALMA